MSEFIWAMPDGTIKTGQEPEQKWVFGVPGNHYTEPMWESLMALAESQRADRVKHYSIGIHKGEQGLCGVCELNSDQLDTRVIENTQTQESEND